MQMAYVEAFSALPDLGLLTGFAWRLACCAYWCCYSLPHLCAHPGRPEQALQGRRLLEGLATSAQLAPESCSGPGSARLPACPARKPGVPWPSWLPQHPPPACFICLIHNPMCRCGPSCNGELLKTLRPMVSTKDGNICPIPSAKRQPLLMSRSASLQESGTDRRSLCRLALTSAA